MRFVFLVSVLSLTLGGAAHASDPGLPPLGRLHFSVALARMAMQHRTFETDDTGLFFNAAGYGRLRGDWYAGGEIGVGGNVALFGLDETTTVPIELNLKRGFGLSRHVALALGGGLCTSWVEYRDNGFFGTGDERTASDWVFGGQVFGEILLHAGWAQTGLQVEYQLTTDAGEVMDLISPGEGWDYSNLKIALHVGILVPSRGG